MNNHQPETEETRRAFKEGLIGMPFNISVGPVKDIIPQNPQKGKIEEFFETIDSLPGLTDAEHAYECGRAIRLLSVGMDQSKAPTIKGREFYKALLGAAVTAKVNNFDQPWGAKQTIEVFIEIFKKGMPLSTQNEIREKTLNYASQRPTSYEE